jgi:transposase
MEAYSKELRRDILRAAQAGEQTKALAVRFNVSESWVRRVKQEFREQGKTAPATTRQRTPQWTAYKDQILKLQTEQPDLTLAELKTALGTKLCRATLCNALRALKLTFKKKSFTRPSKIDRMSPNDDCIGSLRSKELILNESCSWTSLERRRK